MPPDPSTTPDELLEIFVNAQTFKTILQTFEDLCQSLRIDRASVGYGRRSLYKVLTSKLTSWKSKSLWSKLDKRGSQKEYENGNACSDMKVCIVGAGPVGLRLAIECALLGARCIVVEKRDKFSRHNVLHLWPYVITDLKNLAAKTFYGKFATGQIEHISIRQLQCILLKVALLLGVEIYQNVTFIDVIEPTSTQQGWRAKFEPENHPIVSNYELNVLIGADGRRNSLQGFEHKEFRGKLAIGVTCNFVNHHTREEQNFEEISGVAKIYNPQFFNELQQQTSIDLENIVYYKNDTHYFVMTAKKHSLLDKGVILQDFPDAARLLARENVNFTQLCRFACEAGQFATKCSPQFKFEFAESHYGAPDVQMFDFTSLFHAVNTSRIVERHGKQIFMGLVGDSLMESFWPTGSGAGLGFLGLFDTAWAVSKFAKREHPLKILVERESIYLLLSQSTPENTKGNHQLYSINPATRYQNLNSKSCTIDEIRHLFDSDSIPTIDVNNNHLTSEKNLRTTSSVVKRGQSFKPAPVPLSITNNNDKDEEAVRLIDWCKEIMPDYSIDIEKDSKAFQNALAFAAIIEHYRPDLIDFKVLQPERPINNFQKLFDVMHDQLSVPIDRKLQNSLILSMKSAMEERIRQASIVILQFLYTKFHRDHHEQQTQRRRASTTSLDTSAILPSKSPIEINNPIEKSSTVKVSALVAHYSSGDPLTTVTNHTPNLIGLQTERAPTFCFYCKEKVSIQDWFVVEKNVLHVKCFKCATCQLQLRKTNYQVHTNPTTGKISFHCRYHNLNRQQQKDENEVSQRVTPDLVRDQTTIDTNQQQDRKKIPILPVRNNITDERISFTLEKDLIDNDKEEVVYSSRSNRFDENENRENESNDSSFEDTTDEEDDEEVDDEHQETDENELDVGDDDDEEKTSKNSNQISTRAKKHEKSLVQENPHRSIDSGHIQSDSPSPIELSPSPTSQQQSSIFSSNLLDSSTFTYFRPPCPICAGSTYDDSVTIEVDKKLYHKFCVRCCSCDKLLKENEYSYHDQSSNGLHQFYCTLHFCKSRLKQVTNTLETATRQESQTSAIYPNIGSLRFNENDTVRNNNPHNGTGHEQQKEKKLSSETMQNVQKNSQSKVKIGFEKISESINHQHASRSETIDENKSIPRDSSKQRFKRRPKNRPSSPLPSDDCEKDQTKISKPTEKNPITKKLVQPADSSTQRKKKRIPVIATHHHSSSSSASSTSSNSNQGSSSNLLNDERQKFVDERRRQREEKQKESMRLRRSQEIQRELDVLEQKRLELDKNYALARQNLNVQNLDEKIRSYWERECLCLVRERTAVQRHEEELNMAKQGLALENERARAENEYRQLINRTDEQKTQKDREREEQLITAIAKLVEKRNQLTTELDRMRLREIQEDECLRQAYRRLGIEHPITNLQAVDILQDII